MAKVTIVHTVTGVVAEITDHALATVARSGWVLANEDGTPVEGWVAPSDSLELDAPAPVAEAAPAAESVPVGTVDEVLDWVRQTPEDTDPGPGWQDRARAALADEQASTKPRISLVEPLQALLDTDTESQEDHT